MNKFIYLIIFTIQVYFVSAQGSVKIQEPKMVETMMANYVKNNLGNSTVKGWRIQIISTDDRRAMEAAKAKFSQLYPGKSSSWKHVSPYYQLRVGAYREKNDMLNFLAEIKKEFPSATPVMDDFKKIDLISY